MIIKMMWLRIFASLLTLCLALAPASAVVCPDSCVCANTRDGLHRATCSNLTELYKFTLRQKHHNINILDLSYNNITKLNHELDRLTEIVTLDLSANGITKLNKFLQNAQKLVHLNLANNRIRNLTLTHLPISVSSLDLTNNMLQDVPTDIEHLVSLEHLELKGNPIDCSCKNIMARNSLLARHILIDNVKCASPKKFKSRLWLKLEDNDVCGDSKFAVSYLDRMMGDAPVDAIKIGEETNELKSMPLVASSNLEDGNVIHGSIPIEDDDSLMFMKVGSYKTSPTGNDIEGSGETETTTISDFVTQEPSIKAKLVANDESLADDNSHITEDPLEGSGEGSGYGIFLGSEDYVDETEEETTTPIIDELNPEPVHKLIEDDNTTTEFPIPKPPTIYEGGPDWHQRSSVPVTEKPIVPQITRDTTISEQIRVTQASEVLEQSPSEQKVTPHKTGTYVCIAIIVALLVGLIGFAIIKGQMRKRRDRRLLRQQKRDVEKASKEMVDMNKSLLGKPAVLNDSVQKKVNGKYELVPTHEIVQKKSENGEAANPINPNQQNSVRTDSPRDTNQNRSSSKDNNVSEESRAPIQETSFESAPELPESKKDSSSMSSEDIFVPINDEELPKLNGNANSEVSQPLINGDHNTDSDFLSPSREYVPVYSPDLGRVRIKMTETPKPKTPVLVTRSRSNAGDIIITPSVDGNVRKSTT